MGLIHELELLQQEHGHLTDDLLRELAHTLATPLYRIQELVSFYPHFRTTPPAAVTVSVCRDMSCHLAQSTGLAQGLATALGNSDVEVEEVSCLGCCELAPAVRIDGVPVRVESVEALATCLKDGGRPEGSYAPRRLWACDPYEGDRETGYECFRQTLAQFDGSGAIDTLIGTLKASGLRGMGGAGFPTGLKWELVRKEAATPKYVVCNADESEPGTFKDRVILEQLPYLILEGMLVAGLSIGAEKGIIYLRHEYHAARRALEAEIHRARDLGWLGQDILGSGFSFDIEVFISPGGYILGEETALLEALEDKRGEPRNKPPFPGQKGLHGQPTLMNNVETFAYVPVIGLRGAAWWKDQGKGESYGLKCISVSGHVANPGVYEMPLGTTIAELIDMAGGISEGRVLKGFAPGGASSNFLPASMADTPIDFTSLDEAGSMMGSGALVVFAEGTPVLPLAANVVRFFRNESCGKCVPCRDGTEKAVTMLDGALAGSDSIDWETLRKLEMLLVETSICGLGYVALNPLMSAAKHWPDEVPGADSGGGY